MDPVVLDLVAWMKEQGYAAGTVGPVACTAARLSCWLARQSLCVQDLVGAVLSRFAASQARGPHRRPSSARRVVTARKFFVATSLLAPPSPPPPLNPAKPQRPSVWTEIFNYYTHEHRHCRIGLHTPASVHYGTATEVRAQRQVTLDGAYAAHPERFSYRRPAPPKLPNAAWINAPSKEALRQSA